MARLTPKQLEAVVALRFSQSSSDVVRAPDLSKDKAQQYRTYLQSKGYRVIMGAVESVDDKNKASYELHIWRKR